MRLKAYIAIDKKENAFKTRMTNNWRGIYLIAIFQMLQSNAMLCGWKVHNCDVKVTDT